MKPIIIAIAGASGCGKTTLSKLLRDELNVPDIISTTTRPRREDEVEGEDYYFVKSTRRHRREDMLTYTRFGDYEYFSLRSQLPTSGFCSYVVDENGIKSLKDNAGDDYGVYSVLMKCRPELLVARGIDSQRIERDRKRRQISLDYVDLIVYNERSLEDLKQTAHSVLSMVKQWQPLL